MGFSSVLKAATIIQGLCKTHARNQGLLHPIHRIKRSGLEDKPNCLEVKSMSVPEIPAITEKLLAAKTAKGITFAELEKIVGRDEVWIAAVMYRQASASPDEASQLVAALGLDASVAAELISSSSKGLGPIVPTDPLIYRFYEIMQVYGMPIKEVIHEKFGDGIMSAIDFTLDIEKEEDPKGDRVKVIMNGKFLPYKKW